MRPCWIWIVAACSSGKDAPRCEPVIAAATDRMASESGPEAARAMKLAMTAACAADGWSADALRCLEGATLRADLVACTRKLTVEQHERVHDSLGPPSPAIVAPIDAAMRAPDARRDPMANAPPDCRNVIVEPTSLACRQQYCQVHPTDVRCDLEGVNAVERLDCRTRIVDATNRACRHEYCQTHATDPACAAPPPDCSNVVVDPKSKACRDQYCARHPTDVRCSVE